MSAGPAHAARSAEAAARRTRRVTPAEPRPDVARLAEHVGNRATSALLGGQPLPPPLRGEMEDRLGADLGDVRVHSDGAAAAAAAGMRAKAYTVGTDIVFSAGRFDPQTHEGRWLLAHELSHVVQQRRGGPAPALDPGSGLEGEAHAAADAVTAGAPSVAVAGSASPGISRVPEDDDDFVGPRREQSFGTPEFRRLREGFGGGETTTPAPAREVPIGRTNPTENAGPVRLDLDAVPAPIAPRTVTSGQARQEAAVVTAAANAAQRAAPDPRDRPGPNDQQGHIHAIRHVAESGAPSAMVNDPARFQHLHSRRTYRGPAHDPRLPAPLIPAPDMGENATRVAPPVDMGVDVVVVDPVTGRVRINTRHRAQEKLIDDAVARARGGGRLTPQGQDAAAGEVAWRTQGTGFDSRETRRKRPDDRSQQESHRFNEAEAIERMAQDPNSPIARYRRQQADKRAAETETEGPPSPRARAGTGVEESAPASARPADSQREGPPTLRPRVATGESQESAGPPSTGPQGNVRVDQAVVDEHAPPSTRPQGGVRVDQAVVDEHAPPSTRPQGGVRVDQAVVDEHAPPSPAGEEIRPLHENEGSPEPLKQMRHTPEGDRPRSPGSGQGPESGPAPAPTKPPRGPRGGGGSDGGSAGGSAGGGGAPPAGRQGGGGGSAAAEAHSAGGGDVDVEVAPAPARTASRPVAGSARGEGLQVQTPRPGSDQLAPTPRGRLDEATAPAVRRPVQVGEQAPAQAVRAAPVGEPVPAPQAPRPVAPAPVAPAPVAEAAPTAVRAPVVVTAQPVGTAPTPRRAPAAAPSAPAVAPPAQAPAAPAQAPASTEATAGPQARPAGPAERLAPGRPAGPTAVTDHTVHTLGKANMVLGALNQFKSLRQELIEGGKTPDEASQEAGGRAALTLGAHLKGGRIGTAVNAYNSYDAAVRAGKSRTEAVHAAVADVGGHELAAAAVKPSVAGLVVEGINTTAQLVGAPEEVQLATSGAVEFVPSTVVARTGTAGIRSWDALAGAAKGDAKGVDTLVADWKTGGGGPWLQGYTQIVDIGVDVAGGTSFEKAVDRAAKAGKYDAQGHESWGSRAGGKLADAAFSLSQNDKALRGEYSAPVQGLAQGLRVASELAVGKSFGESIDAVTKASRGGPGHRTGQVIRKEAAKAAAAAEQVKASVVQKATDVKTAAVTGAADLAHDAGETATRMKDKVVETARRYADEAAAAARVAAEKARATKNSIASFIGW